MKSRHVGSVLLFVGLVLGLAIGAGWLDQRARAQAAAASASRFQISAWGANVQAGRFEHGCYMVDTETGELWHTFSNGTSLKVESKGKK